jgi:hypothetical protein
MCMPFSIRSHSGRLRYGSPILILCFIDNHYTLITASAQRTLFYEMFPRHVYGAETTERDIGVFLGMWF